MADATLTIAIDIPAAAIAGALSPDAAARVIAKEALDKIICNVGDPRQTSGSTTHLVSLGNSVTTGTGTWTWAPPS
jgi:ApbE superfamily uncharacterized protein (UPF0280 family)